MIHQDVAIGDTFEHESRPGVAHEVVALSARADDATLAGYGGVLASDLADERNGWRRCEARAVMRLPVATSEAAPLCLDLGGAG